MKLWQSRYNPQYKLSQQDLLDISEEITQAYSPHVIQHQPELVLMPVDPINLYAYWNLQVHGVDKDVNDIGMPLVLRIYSLPEFSERPNGMKLRFDIRVHGLKSQKKVHLPVAAMAYSAIIGEINADNSFNTWAASEIIHVPRKDPVLECSVKAQATAPTETLENDFVTEAGIVPDIAHELKSKTVAQTSATETMAVNLENTQAEACVLKNFNEHGYDLVVYEHDDASEFKALLANQVSNIQLDAKNITTLSEKTSGLGLNL